MKRLPCVPQDVSDRLTTLCLPLCGNKSTTGVVADAHHPRMATSDNVKNKFYEDMHVLRVTALKIMQKFGCPERFTQMVRQLHDGMMARVTDNGAVSEAFAGTNGVKQRFVLAPTLFSLMFSVMLMDAFRDERRGIRIAYRTDGHLLDQRRMNFQSRVSTATVHELLFADDCALNTTSAEEM
nr:unnamed protein product [Spirometra erinaceieuropaei]